MFKKYFLYCLWLCCFVSFSSYGQGSDNFYYVVIGGFASEDNAIRFTDNARASFSDANYALNAQRQIFYVYALRTSDRAEASALAKKARAMGEFSGTWVFLGTLEEVFVDEPEEEIVNVPDQIEEVVVTEVVEELQEIVEEPIQDEPEEVAPVKANERPFEFSLTSANTGEKVFGQVYIAEQRESNDFQTYDGNEQVYVKQPANRAQTYSMVINAPGYEPLETTLDYKAYTEDSVETGETVVVDVQLIRSKKGNYIEFNKVNFLINAALFTPDSETELNAFADLLKKNPKYKIRVHGHCNGKFDRNGVIKGDSPGFFATNPGNKEQSMSAKKFTQYRAEVVKEYLVAQGISSKRIKTAGDGGNAMLFPSNGPLAKLNDRVEIEIIKGK